MSEIGLKGASGLGDTIYGVAIAKYFSSKYDTVHIMSDYPMLFSHIPNVKCYKYQKLNYIKTPKGDIPITKRFTYCGRKYTPGTTQFEDSYISIGIEEKLDMSIPWKVRNKELVDDIKKKAAGKKICYLQPPYEPFSREDQWGALLRIKPDIMQSIVNKYSDSIFFIQSGSLKWTLHKINNTQMDLVGKTNYVDGLDIISVCDFSIAQIGNTLPMSECHNKKNFIIFADAALKCDNKFLSAITPEKVVHCKQLNCSVIDNESIDIVLNKFEEFIK